MIIVYIIQLFIAVLLFMLLGFIDIVYNLIMGKQSNLAEKFCEAMNVIVGVICAAVCGVGIPVLIFVLTVCNWHAYYWISFNGRECIMRVQNLTMIISLSALIISVTSLIMAIIR